MISDFLVYVEGSKALFDGLGWCLDDLGCLGQHLEFLEILHFFIVEKSIATPPKVNDMIKLHDKKKKKQKRPKKGNI